MKLADQIRAHVTERHLRPARDKGFRQVELRAGDIHHEMNLTARMPAVCSAMGGAKLQGEAKVNLAARRGPANGANVRFTYSFDGIDRTPKRPASAPLSRSTDAKLRKTAPALAPAFDKPHDLKDALVLVSCTKSKLSRAALARDFYISTFFDRARGLVERRGADWRILSAKYGLVHPDELIEPYELTLNAMPVSRRNEWASRVLEDLLPLAENHGRVIFLAGQKYREFLKPALEAEGIRCEAPMAHLRQGEQLEWLAQQ